MTHIIFDNYLISTDKDLLNISKISSFLQNSYWAQGRSKEIIEKSIINSLCFGLYKEATQIGFARVITDYSTFAYLCDVYLEEVFRGNGLGSMLVSVILKSEELQAVNKFMLATLDAHTLYKKLGFTEVNKENKYMEFIV